MWAQCSEENKSYKGRKLSRVKQSYEARGCVPLECCVAGEVQWEIRLGAAAEGARKEAGRQPGGPPRVLAQAGVGVGLRLRRHVGRRRVAGRERDARQLGEGGVARGVRLRAAGQALDLLTSSDHTLRRVFGHCQTLYVFFLGCELGEGGVARGVRLRAAGQALDLRASSEHTLRREQGSLSGPVGFRWPPAWRRWGRPWGPPPRRRAGS